VITGHFGLAAGAKSTEPSAPLWSLMLATMWLDVVFTPLYLAGVETLETPPGGGYGTSLIHADYTHSLLGALLLSALFGALAGFRWGRRVAVVLAAVAFSHWVLDLVVHRADLPLLPGNLGGLPLLGFGLWRVPVASILLEAALLVGGVFLYWRTAQRTSRPASGSRVTPTVVSAALLLSGVVVLVLDAFGL
jgi:membrane-bound metal-dependent hydrolase YbcI (DUF457 family)